MEAIYTLSDGRKILISWNKYAKPINILARYRYFKEDGTYCEPISKRIKLQKEKSTNRLYFVINGEKKYNDDFDYDSVDTLIEKINNLKSSADVKDCEILATFLKDTENVGLIAELKTRSFAVRNGYLVALCPEQEFSDPLLCVPTERNCKKRDWDSVITFEHENEELRDNFVEEWYYFDDFCSRLRARDGRITLVNKNKYKEENNPKILRK